MPCKSTLTTLPRPFKLGTAVSILQTGYPYIQASSQDKEWGMHHHMPCSTGPCLPVEVGSGAVMCPVALDLASLIGRAPVCHVSYSSGSCLPTGEGSRAPCVLQL
jgi:hypothetical protein